MKLNNLALKDKKLFTRYLSLGKHELSVYSFENIYIWNRLFKIRWAVIDNRLSIFFSDKSGSFLYLPPLGESFSREAVSGSLLILDSLNCNSEISRIENIEEEGLKAYQGAGYDVRPKMPEYLCLRKDLADLKGNRFKHKRSAYNHFVKNNQFQYSRFNIRHKKECLRLYQDWMKARKSMNTDRVYQGMLEDSLLCLESLFSSWRHLKLLGAVIKINKKIKGFTLGFAINKDTFCISYEITDLYFKGMAQFIFSAFSRDLKKYKYINIMDDSGLENLRKVKLSYHPLRLIPAYIAKRKTVF